MGLLPELEEDVKQQPCNGSQHLTPRILGDPSYMLGQLEAIVLRDLTSFC